MKYFINKNAKFSTIENVTIIGNTQHGGFIGLNAEGKRLFDKVLAGVELEPKDFTTEEVRLIEAGIELNILCRNSNEESPKPNKVVSAYLHVTNRCNLHCIGCYSNNRDRNAKNDLTLQEITKILDELKDNGLETLSISGGEPFLRADIRVCF